MGRRRVRGPMARQFARLRRGNTPESTDVSVVPDEGMCLSAFLVIRRPGTPGEVLLGRMDPTADWLEIGGLGPDRVARFGSAWVLPAGQLLLFESPDDAARRLARELLGVELGSLPTPRVFSEAYSRPGGKGNDPHWDLHFVYEVPWPEGRPLRARPWKELAFVPVAKTPRSAFGRNHGDVLELVGLPPAPGAP
jgi:8-oxo-dGTP pyrophosphatase MutT (NUDIX family)